MQRRVKKQKIFPGPVTMDQAKGRTKSVGVKGGCVPRVSLLIYRLPRGAGLFEPSFVPERPFDWIWACT